MRAEFRMMQLSSSPMKGVVVVALSSPSSLAPYKDKPSNSDQIYRPQPGVDEPEVKYYAALGRRHGYTLIVYWFFKATK